MKQQTSDPVADPDQTFVGQSNKGGVKILNCLKPKVAYENRWISHKSG